MNIGLSTSVIQRGKTGIAQWAFAMVRAFMAYADEHKFTLFVLEKDLPLFDFAAEKMRLIPVNERYRKPLHDVLWHQTVLPKMAKRLGLDVIHIPSYRRLLWSAPCPVVATIHDLAPFHVANKYDWKRMVYAKCVVPQLTKRCHKLMAVSANTADDMANFFGLSRENIMVIHNGLDHSRFAPDQRREAMREAKESLGLKQPFFLYLARLEHPAKNHIRLIDAFNAFKRKTQSDWQLVFGGSDWHGSEAIHSAVRRSPYASEIRSLGFVPDAQLPILYRAADTLVCPSLHEGFGMPPVEAMASGCPVISSTAGALRETVGEAALAINPLNIDDIEHALTKVAANPELRTRLIEKGLKNAQRFHWDKAARATLTVYEESVRECQRAPVESCPQHA